MHNPSQIHLCFITLVGLIIAPTLDWRRCHAQSTVDQSTGFEPIDIVTTYHGMQEIDGSSTYDATPQFSAFPNRSCPPIASTQTLDSLAWKKGPWKIIPYGYLTGEVIASSAAITSRPFVLFVNNDIGIDEKQFTVHGQTTALGVDITGPMVGSLKSGGNVLFNFLGDRPIANQSTPFLLRAYGDLTNENWRFGFGVAPDVFGARTPTTVNFGGNLQAGNIAAFRGQLRAERYFRPSDYFRCTMSGAISQQVVTDFVNNPSAIGTDNGWPNLEGRMLFGFGQSETAESPFEFGMAGVIGETRSIDLSNRNVTSTWGISIDGLLDLGRCGASFEVFTGEAIGTYNAAIGQSLNPENGEAIATVGGFAEIWCKPIDSLAWHIGYGTDDPNNADLGRVLDNVGAPIAGQKSRNSVFWTNLLWNVTNAFQLDFEVSHRETEYIAPSISNDAMIYHFRTRLTF